MSVKLKVSSVGTADGRTEFGLQGAEDAAAFGGRIAVPEEDFKKLNIKDGDTVEVSFKSVADPTEEKRETERREADRDQKTATNKK